MMTISEEMDQTRMRLLRWMDYTAERAFGDRRTWHLGRPVFPTQDEIERALEAREAWKEFEKTLPQEIFLTPSGSIIHGGGWQPR